MGKATIIEAQNSNTVYEQGKSKGILGKLKGVFADYKNGTRNADRLYTEELWDNRVFGSEDVMEALNTKTLFGELDHPEGDRCETLAKNAAVTITKLEKRPEEGVIYGEAEILDTPTGRIVKALADSGAQLGISSRGMGEEIYKNGKNIIDPDTYDFITFDVVVTPANTKARVSLTESTHINKLTESLEKEINECETKNQLNQVKQVIESVNLTNKDKLIEKINTKLNKDNETLENKDNKLVLEARKYELASKLLKEKLDDIEKQLQESLTANEQLSQENNKLIENKEFLEESRNTLKTKVKESTQLNKQIVNKLEESTKIITRQENSNQITLQKQRSLFEAKINKLNEQIKTLKINKIEESNNKSYKEDNKKLVEENKKLIDENKQKDLEYKELNKKVEENSKILIDKDNEIKQLNETIEKLKANAKLTESKIQQEKLAESEKVKTLENKIKELQTTQRNFTDLSFNPLGVYQTSSLNNDETLDMDDEDRALFNVLTNR